MDLASRLLTTASNPLDIFSSQRLLESGEILRMWSVLMMVRAMNAAEARRVELLFERLQRMVAQITLPP